MTAVGITVIPHPVARVCVWLTCVSPSLNACPGYGHGGDDYDDDYGSSQPSTTGVVSQHAVHSQRKLYALVTLLWT